MSNLIDDIENYFKYQKEVYGESLYLDKKFEIDFSMPEPIQITDLNAQNTNKTVNTLDNLTENQMPRKKAEPVNQPSEPLAKGVRLDHSIAKDAIIDAKQTITVDNDWKDSSSMEELYDKIHNCHECPLGNTRNKFVFGKGNFNADIMVIGEGPGADEDEKGEPFVGRAGQLLTKILEAIQLSRDDVFIANIVKCRPPNNRAPFTEEVNKCEIYLQKQIELIKPEFILALGLTAADTLLRQKNRMADIRGKIFDYHGIKTMVTYHPAALLRNPNLKRPAWEDVQILQKLYKEYLEKKNL